MQVRPYKTYVSLFRYTRSMNQKEALLAGAKQCLVQKGYGRTTARDIAEASGAHLGSIGYHYGSKDRLMNQAALELSSEWGDTITQALVQASGSTPRERLATALISISASLPDSRTVQSASLQAFVQALFDDSLYEQIAAGQTHSRRAFAALLAGEEEDTDKDLSEAETALGALTSALTIGLAVQSLLDPDSLSGAQELTAALQLLANDGD